MPNNRSSLSPSTDYAQELTPASFHIDEAVTHSQDHAYSEDGGYGGHPHDHSHARASTKRLGWALTVTDAVVIAELVGAS